MPKIKGNYLSAKSKVADCATLEAPVRLYGSARIREKATVGRFSFVNTRSTVYQGGKVGRYCSIGKNVEVGPFNHPMERISTSPVSYHVHLHFPDFKDTFPSHPFDLKSGAVIGNDVWIGTNAMIMRNVTVGDGAVIGAGSIVTKDVEPYSIVVGTPAQHLRYRFDEQTRATLLGLAWWDLSVEEVSKIPFHDLEESVAYLKHLRGV
ncbi:CatB-related O-acetyltransferase [Roseovarius aestuarii]|nr:CatB-related O-acetyltransferase [Roseovarius aestuarii]